MWYDGEERQEIMDITCPINTLKMEIFLFKGILSDLKLNLDNNLLHSADFFNSKFYYEDLIKAYEDAIEILIKAEKSNGS